MKRLSACFGVVALVGLLSGCPDPNVLYLCIGDSVTQGLPEGSYPKVLDDLLQTNGYCGPPYCVANRGRFGEMACGDQGWVAESVDRRLFPNADTVLYWEGANDLMWYVYANNHALDHGPTHEDLQAIHAIVFECIAGSIGIVRSVGLDVLVGTYYYLVPGVDVFGWGELTEEQVHFANQYVDALNATIIALANQEGVPVVPIHTLGVLGDGSDLYYLPDGAHPNVAGYELIAQVWYETIVESE